MKLKRNKKGFTLIELLIVVIIVGILASVAVPQYISSTERAQQAKATSNMEILAQGLKMVRANSANGQYPAAVADGAWVAALANFVDVASVDIDPSWTYNMAAAAGNTTFIITAARVGGTNGGETITINELGQVGTAGWTP